MVRLAAFDMDGTLLMPDHQIGQLSLETLFQLNNHGVILTFATGRHYIEMKSVLARAGLQGHLITGNGTQIHDMEGNKLQGVDLPPDVAYHVLHSHWDTHASMHAFREEGWFTAYDQPRMLLAHQFSGFHYQLTDLRTLPAFGNNKVCFCGAYDDLLQLKIQLEEQFTGQVDFCFSAADCLEVLPLGCNKGSALAILSEHLGVTLAQCMAFGDAMNDKEMLESVGQGLVMGNALSELKNQLPHLPVIGPCSKQAVAHYLQHWLHSPHLSYSPEY
ncbi:HMP-PP phosphatase [Edaphovirga cremea]|uniref:HMP-PP phosphatase n=1 Tax=Edaphovirga cremea TaxID=2267246 RepID=UPI00398913AA